MEKSKNLLKLDFDQQRFDDAITRAWVDQEYRRRLISDPKKTLREAGVEFPKSVKVHVHEFDPDDRHIFLPPLVSPLQDTSQEAAKQINRPREVPSESPRPAGKPQYGVARVFLQAPAEERRENNG